MFLFLCSMDNGVRSGDITMTWHSIYQDVMSAVSVVHDKNVSLCRARKITHKLCCTVG